MNDLWIKKIYYQKLPENVIRGPRARFSQYYADLCAETNMKPMQAESFMQGSQYSYVALFDSLLPDVQAAGDLANLELIVISFWSPEFDPDHACGAYLCHRYQFGGKILDISDCGFLAPFTALAAIQAYMRQENISRALFLSADQTTVPYTSTMDRSQLPSCTSVTAWLIVKDPQIKAGLKLIATACQGDHQLADYLSQICEKNHFSLNDVLLTCHQEVLDKNLLDKNLPFKNIVYTTCSGNSVEKLFALKILSHSRCYARYNSHILLVHDQRAHQWGVLIVRNFI